MASQIEIQTELNRLVAERTKAFKEQSSLIKGQISLAAALCKALDCAPQEEVLNTLNQMTDALEEAGEAAADASDQNKKMGQAINRAFNEARGPMAKAKVLFDQFSKQFPIAAAGVAGFVDGLVSGFKFAVSTLKSAFDIIVQVGQGILGIGKAIISIPFKMLGGLIEISNKLAESMDAVRQAIEDVRKEFGDITSGPSRDIIQMSKDLGGTLAGTGMSGYKVFGNLAERMKFVSETARGMGASFETVRHELEGKTGEAILQMQKGLGFTGEDMGAVARQAMSMGKTTQSSLINLTKISTDFGYRFNISAKTISRDMAMMIKDVKNFGSLAPIELAKISVYTKKLGIDIKEVLGVIDKFDTFEDAATSAAKLGQAFGANIDAVAMMREQDPTKRIQMMRDAFFAAGNSVENMSRQERKLLEQTTGLSDAAVQAAFSQKNMGVSMQDLDKQGKMSEKRQISQEEALVRLTDAIDRMVKSMGTFHGFFQAFTDGFARGIFVQKDFREMLTNLRVALFQTKMAGIDVGKAFVETFAGGSIKGIINFFKDVFKTGKDANGQLTPFSIMLQEVSHALKDFFSAVAGDPDALPRLFKRLKFEFESFFQSFDTGKLEGFANTFATTMGNMISGALRVVAEQLPKIVDLIINFIDNPKIPSNVPGSGLARSFIDPILIEFEKGKSIDKISEALKKLFSKLWEKAQPYVEDIAGKIGMFMFGVALTKAATSIMTMVVGEVLKNAVTGWISTGGPAAFGSSISTAIGTAFAAINPVVWVAAAVVAVGALSVGMSKGMTKFKGDLRKEFGETESMVGASIAGIVDTLSFGLVPESLSKKIGEFTAQGTKSLISAMKSLPFGEELSKVWEQAVQAVIGTFVSLGDLIMALFSSDDKKISSSGQELGKNFTKWIKVALIDWMPAVFKTLGGLLKQGGELLIVGLGWVLAEGIPILLGVLSDAIGGILNIFAGISFQIGEFLGEIPLVGGVLKSVFEFIGVMFEMVGGWFTDLGNNFTTLRNSWSLFGQLFVEMVDSWWTTIKDVFNAGVTLVSGAFDTLIEIGSNAVDAILAPWKMFGSGLMTVIDAAITGVKDLLGISSPSKMFMDIGISMMEGVISGFKNMGGALVDGFKGAIGGIGDTLADAAKGGLGAFKDVFGIHSPSSVAGDIGQSIIDGMMKSISVMPNMITAVAEKGLNGLEGKFDKSSLASTFEGFASPMLGVVKGMVEETNEITKMIGSMGPINIDAKLKEMAEKLGVSSKELTIDRGDIKLHINLNVIMEADKVADAIIATKKVLKSGE